MTQLKKPFFTLRLKGQSHLFLVLCCFTFILSSLMHLKCFLCILWSMDTVLFDSHGNPVVHLHVLIFHLSPVIWMPLLPETKFLYVHGSTSEFSLLFHWAICVSLWQDLKGNIRISYSVTIRIVSTFVFARHWNQETGHWELKEMVFAETVVSTQLVLEPFAITISLRVIWLFVLKRQE